MTGAPVWLASISHQAKLTQDFTPAERAKAKALLLTTLEGYGNPTRQRFFRMCVTMCMHRALSDAEVRQLPESFHCAPSIDIAGGPVEILEETEPGLPSTRPCLAPTWADLGGRRGAKFPLDCGMCEPCRARARIPSGS